MNIEITDEKLENEGGNENGQENINVELVLICMSITAVVFVVGNVMGVYMKMRRRRQTEEDEPKMEKNEELWPR